MNAVLLEKPHSLTSHQIREVAKRLAENHVAVLRVAFFQLFLQVTAAMLVLAKNGDFSLKVFKAGTSEAVD